MGGLAGSQSRQHPSVLINSTRADTTTISCMVASQYGRWARSRYSGEAGAASPVCCLTCSKTGAASPVCCLTCPGGTRPQPASVPSMLQLCPGRRPAARPQGAAEGPSGHPWDEAQYSLCEDDITPYHGLGVQRRPRSVHDRVPSGAGRVRAGPRARQSRPSHELRIFRRTDIVGGETSRQRGATRRKGKAGRAAAC